MQRFKVAGSMRGRESSNRLLPSTISIRYVLDYCASAELRIATILCSELRNHVKCPFAILNLEDRFLVHWRRHWSVKCVPHSARAALTGLSKG